MVDKGKQGDAEDKRKIVTSKRAAIIQPCITWTELIYYRYRVVASFSLKSNFFNGILLKCHRKPSGVVSKSAPIGKIAAGKLLKFS